MSVINQIEKLEHFREHTCWQCGHIQREFILTIQADCVNCGRRGKLRGYGAIGTEVEDVVDAVLEWVVRGDVLSLALARMAQIMAHLAEEERLEEEE